MQVGKHRVTKTETDIRLDDEETGKLVSVLRIVATTPSSFIDGERALAATLLELLGDDDKEPDEQHNRKRAWARKVLSEEKKQPVATPWTLPALLH